MQDFSLSALQAGLRQKTFSAVELTRSCLDRIDQNQDLNAFISVSDHALAAAKAADQRIKAGKAGPLTGIPIGVKDIFCTTDMPTTCGSKMLANYTSPYDATVISRLREAGAVLIGKTNMDEFAMGSANENSYFGAVKNPWNKNRVPGGSSGGSAAAVAADLVPLALGSDTGGSIRQPAAFCGISGLKPTYGLVSRYGMVAYASSLDQGGPMARSVADLLPLLQAIVGHDPRDSTALQAPRVDYAAHLGQTIKGLKIGVPDCFLSDATAPGVSAAIQTALKTYTDLGAEIIPVQLAQASLWIPCYYVIACAEASSNLSRYDGIRFGYRSPNYSDLQSLMVQSRSEGFGLEVQRRILTGTHVLSAGYFDAYYLQALKIRRLIRDELLGALQQVDVLMGPTTPTVAFALGEMNRDPVQNYLADIFTVAVNLAGLPALSIPAGFDAGLPVGLQIIGNPLAEAKLLAVGHAYQQETDWHLRTAMEKE